MANVVRGRGRGYADIPPGGRETRSARSSSSRNTTDRGGRGGRGAEARSARSSPRDARGRGRGYADIPPGGRENRSARSSSPRNTTAHGREAAPPDTLGATSDDRAVEKLRSRGLTYAGFDGMRQQVSERTNNERFNAFFGVSAGTVHAVLLKVRDKHPNLKEKDFFIALNFLKLYETYRKLSLWTILSCSRVSNFSISVCCSS